MRESMKKLIEEMGGTVLMDGALIQFSEQSFEATFKQIYEAGMARALLELTDTPSESSGGVHGRH